MPQISPRDEGFVRLDDRKRIPIGRYTELDEGSFYRIERGPRGVLTLTPAIVGVEAVD